MVFAGQEHMVEGLAPKATDKSFATGIHVRGPHGRLDHPSTDACGNTVEYGSDLFVAVSNQEPRREAVHCRIPQLLRRPFLGWVPRSRQVDYLPRSLVQ